VLLHFLRSHVRRPGAEKGAHLQLGQGSRGDLTVEAVHGMNCYTSLAIVRMRERERERMRENISIITADAGVWLQREKPRGKPQMLRTQSSSLK
jgi:hypothetical protein